MSKEYYNKCVEDMRSRFEEIEKDPVQVIKVLSDFHDWEKEQLLKQATELKAENKYLREYLSQTMKETESYLNELGA